MATWKHIVNMPIIALYKWSMLRMMHEQWCVAWLHHINVTGNRRVLQRCNNGSHHNSHKTSCVPPVKTGNSQNTGDHWGNYLLFLWSDTAAYKLQPCQQTHRTLRPLSWSSLLLSVSFSLQRSSSVPECIQSVPVCLLYLQAQRTCPCDGQSGQCDHRGTIHRNNSTAV